MKAASIHQSEANDSFGETIVEGVDNSQVITYESV